MKRRAFFKFLKAAEAATMPEPALSYEAFDAFSRKAFSLPEVAARSKSDADEALVHGKIDIVELWPRKVYDQALYAGPKTPWETEAKLTEQMKAIEPLQLRRVLVSHCGTEGHPQHEHFHVIPQYVDIETEES